MRLRKWISSRIDCCCERGLAVIRLRGDIPRPQPSALRSVLQGPANDMVLNMHALSKTLLVAAGALAFSVATAEVAPQFRAVRLVEFLPGP
jgi:hypothetical protein